MGFILYIFVCAKCAAMCHRDNDKVTRRDNDKVTRRDNDKVIRRDNAVFHPL